MTLRDRIRALAASCIPRGATNALLRWARQALGPRRFDSLMGRGHRTAGYEMLRGHGIEVGALRAPATLPKGCRVTYVDAITTEQARTIFPEIDAARLVRVDIVTDLDRTGLASIADGAYDFAVMNHVIEHVANPVKVIEELFRVVRPGGLVAISAPDMRFSFDRNRPLTTDDHLIKEYAEGVSEVSDWHYEEFVRSIMPVGGVQDVSSEVAQARERREHVHVWDSASFERFMPVALQASGNRGTLRYLSMGDENRLEYFAVWCKGA